jgi:hypothetical protein
MTDEELAHERALVQENVTADTSGEVARGTFGVPGVLAWLAVGIPFLIGLYIAIERAVVLLS